MGKRGPKPRTHCKRGHELTPENTKQVFSKNGTKNGRTCRICRRMTMNACYARNSKKYTEMAKRYREKDPSRKKSNDLKRMYGITLEDYNNLLNNQNGKCFICKTDNPGRYEYFQVDHCHITRKVRSLLCVTCNLAIGTAKDDPVLLRKMADYIDFHNNQLPLDETIFSNNLDVDEEYLKDLLEV